MKRRAAVCAECPGVGTCADDCLTSVDCPCGGCVTTTEGKRCMASGGTDCAVTCASSADCTDPRYPTCLVENLGDSFCPGGGNVCGFIRSSFDVCPV